MSFSIDHATFMVNIAAMWDFINTGNYLTYVLTLICGWFIFKIFSGMFSDDD